MMHYVNIFLLLFGALQGFLLSLWFFKSAKFKIPNVYLTLLLITVSLQLTFKVITKLWLMENVGWVYTASYKLPYLIGPLLFLYIRSNYHPKWNVRDLLHFIPFIFFIAFHFLRLGYIHPYLQATYKIISLGIYVYLSLQISNKMQKQFITWVGSSQFIVIIVLAVMYMHYTTFPDVRWLFIILTVVVYWITYKVVSHSKLFENATPILPLRSSDRKKYANSSLKPEEAIQIEYELLAAMNQKKMYTESSLTIDSLAEALRTSRHHLSQVINERLHKTYSDYISELRLEEARSRLSNPANYRFTIAAIALDSGFNSVSSFNEVFKKRYGTTPSKFREQYLNKMSA